MRRHAASQSSASGHEGFQDNWNVGWAKEIRPMRGCDEARRCTLQERRKRVPDESTACVIIYAQHVHEIAAREFATY
jgi:hypothetical protein